MLVSVLWFALSPAAAVVLFVFEAWVYMTLRAAVEGAFERAPGEDSLSMRLLWLPLGIAGAGLVYGVLLGAYASFVCVVLYDAGDLIGFFTSLMAEPGLLMSATVLVLVELVDAGRYAVVVRGGYRPPPKSLQLTFMRVIVLIFPAALLNGVDAPPTVASWTMLIAMLLSILYFEGLPTIARASLASGKGLP